MLLTREHLERLAEIGLDHVQVSVQDVVPDNADRISGYKGGLAKKRDVARWARELGLGLTINAPMHRQNHRPFAAKSSNSRCEVDAQRIEVAHIQYYAWAERNRAALIPTREKFVETVAIVEEAKARLAGVLNFDFVIHDHYAKLPKACMGGWARSIVVVTPSGRVLPCHAAQTLPGLIFDNVRERPLADIWRNGAAFQAFRGDGLDEGAVPHLRPARDRLRRLPLSGLRRRRRRRGGRSGLPSFAQSRAIRIHRRSGIATGAAALRLSTDSRRKPVAGS